MFTNPSVSGPIVIFIAHAHADRDFANALKHEITRVFDACEVFCTSSPATIGAGEDWLAEVEKPLRAAKAVVALVTPASIGRSWLWFEIGAAWLNEQCRIYPLCAPEIHALDLPAPLDRLQSIWLKKPGDLKVFIDAIVTQFGTGKANAFRPTNILKQLRASWTDDKADTTVLGFSPLHYACKIIGDHKTLYFTDEDGDLFNEDIRFDVFVQLVLGVLQTEMPEGGFSDEYVYMRVWKALQRISEEGPIYFHPKDFSGGMDALRLVGVLEEQWLWRIAPLGWQVLQKYPMEYSEEQLNEILTASEQFEFPSYEEAENFLFKGWFK